MLLNLLYIPQKTNANNKYSYTKYKSPNLKGIVDFPTPNSQIPKVEKHFDLAIYVYGESYAVSKKIEKINIFPYHISEQPKEKPIINLLLISEDVEIVTEDTYDDGEGIVDENYDPDADYSTGLQKEDKYHCCWINNLNRLLYDQNKQKCKTFFCDRCLHGFTKEDLLIKHK